MGRTLVCQDLNHVETMYPFSNNENAIFIQPDWSNLQQKLTELKENVGLANRVAGKGKKDWIKWAGNSSGILRKVFTRHLAG